MKTILNNQKEPCLSERIFMRYVQIHIIYILGILVLAFPMLADTLVMKDGTVLQGKFISGTSEALQFEVDGETKNVAIGEITSITFSPRELRDANSPRSTAPVAGTAEQAPSGPVTVPAGTKLMLKTEETISTHSHKKGTKVSAVLQNDLVVNGTVAVDKGTQVYGTVLESFGGRALGGAQLVLTFNGLSINNQLISIVTDDVGAATEPGGAARTVGAGALIGAAAGDAGAGAAVGGAAALMRARRNHLQVPAETLVEVSLKQPLTIQ
jgi:hypothetical protein